MDANTITALVTSVGFPILVSIACGYALKYMFDVMMRRLEDESKRHAEEVEKITEALNNNTTALTILSERIEK